MTVHRYKFQDMTFWAEHGLVYIEDQRDGDFQVLTADEAFERAKQLACEVQSCKYADEALALLRLVESMADCHAEAKAQGDPTDEKVLEQKAREARPSRAARVLLPSGAIPGAEEKLELSDPNWVQAQIAEEVKRKRKSKK